MYHSPLLADHMMQVYSRVSKDIGHGHFPKLTRFEEPWEFFIIDNFLSEDVYNILCSIKDRNLYKFIDEYNGEMNVGTNLIKKESGNYPHKKSINIGKFPEVVDALHRCVSDKIKDLLPETFYIASDLVRCQPGYRYNLHKDHVDKYISIIVYLGMKGNGTTFMSNDNIKYKVGWKMNRAVLFLNDNHGLHEYANVTKQDRYTLNIYVTKQKDVTFGVTTEVN